jgi:hypothetical protein
MVSRDVLVVSGPFCSSSLILALGAEGAPWPGIRSCARPGRPMTRARRDSTRYRDPYIGNRCGSTRPMDRRRRRRSDGCSSECERSLAACVHIHTRSTLT